MQTREGLEVVLFELGAELFHHLGEGGREGGREGGALRRGSRAVLPSRMKVERVMSECHTRRRREGGREGEKEGTENTYLRRVLGIDPHLPQMALGHGVALESILVPALLLAHLAVPSQTLQALRLGLVGNGLGRAGRGFRHGSVRRRREGGREGGRGMSEAQ
jgi:hypothetical protein